MMGPAHRWRTARARACARASASGCSVAVASDLPLHRRERAEPPPSLKRTEETATGSARAALGRQRHLRGGGRWQGGQAAPDARHALCGPASPSERCCARRWLRNMRPPHALRRDRASISAGTTSVRRLGECQLMPAVLPAALIQAASLPSGATLQATKPATSSHQWQRYTLHLLASCY
jgi:hypothetical protein